MWKRTSRVQVSALALTTVLALQVGAAPVRAVTYDDSFQECNYPRGFDLVVMRPLSMVTIVLGATLFIPLAPLAFFTVPNEVDDLYDDLIGAPARFTFVRALGECTGVDLSY